MNNIQTETPKFKLTLRDFSAFYAVWRKRNILFQTEARRLGLYMFLLAAVLLWNSRANMLSPDLSFGMKGATIVFYVIAIFLFALLLAAFLAFIISPAMIYIWQAVRFLIGPVGKYPQTLKASLEGIVKTVNETSHTTAWADVSDFVETKKTLLIFTGKNSAFIVPRSAFASDESAADFTDILNTYRALGLRS
jgi:hypothetical protein